MRIAKIGLVGLFPSLMLLLGESWLPPLCHVTSISVCGECTKTDMYEMLLFSLVYQYVCTHVCVWIGVLQGAGEVVLHREQPQERVNAFLERPGNLNGRK